MQDASAQAFRDCEEVVSVLGKARHQMTSVPAVFVLGDAVPLLLRSLAATATELAQGALWVTRQQQSYVLSSAGSVCSETLLGLVALHSPTALSQLQLDLALRVARRRGLSRLVVLLIAQSPSVPGVDLQHALISPPRVMRSALELQTDVTHMRDEVLGKLARHGFDTAGCLVLQASLETPPPVAAELATPAGECAQGSSPLLSSQSLDELFVALQLSEAAAARPSADSSWRELDALLGAIEKTGVPFTPLACASHAQLAAMTTSAGGTNLGALGTALDVLPYLEAGDRWPTCPRCRKLMEIPLQVDPSDAGILELGLFVAFACCTESDSPQTLVRYYSQPLSSKRIPATAGLPTSWSNAPRSASYLIPQGRFLRMPGFARQPEAVQQVFGKAKLQKHSATLAEMIAQCYCPGALLQRSAAWMGGATEAPSCPHCMEAQTLLFSAVLRSQDPWLFQLWMCPCSPVGAHLTWVPRPAAAPSTLLR